MWTYTPKEKEQHHTMMSADYKCVLLLYKIFNHEGVASPEF
jgi:hypothetical protein